MSFEILNQERIPLSLTATVGALLGECLRIAPEISSIIVHGSTAFGEFIEGRSDFDLLFVVGQEITPRQRHSLSRTFLALSDVRMASLEASFVTVSACRQWTHPCPYEFHFSEHVRHQVEEALSTQGTEGDLPAPEQGDPDLAAHFLVARAVGFPLFGLTPEDIIPQIPRTHVRDSLDQDLHWGRHRLLSRPQYFILNLARRAAWMSDGTVLSKLQGGEWARDKVSPGAGRILNEVIQRQKGVSTSIAERDLQMLAAELLKLCEPQ